MSYMSLYTTYNGNVKTWKAYWYFNNQLHPPSFHDHRTEDHKHEQHNFKTHDSSHTASSARVDHGLSVTSGHAHGLAHGHAVLDHG